MRAVGGAVPCAAAKGRLDSLPAAVAQEILEDENSFAIRLAAGALPDAADPDRMAEAARRDLDVLYRAATIQPETLCAALETGLSARLPDWGVAAAAAPLDTPWGDALPALAAYHAAHGCGRFAAHRAFLWRDGALHPVEHPDPIRLSDLKDYARSGRSRWITRWPFWMGSRRTTCCCTETAAPASPPPSRLCSTNTPAGACG